FVPLLLRPTPPPPLHPLPLHDALPIFKTFADPFVGKISYFKVYSGTLSGDSQLHNANKGKDERIGQIFTMLGKNQINLDKVPAGDRKSTRLNSSHVKISHAVCCLKKKQ